MNRSTSNRASRTVHIEARSAVGGGPRENDAFRGGRGASPSQESGQALVEFAVVLPLLVMAVLFAIWFYELTHVKLKLQEAARFAAWETTAFPMHSYKAGPGSSIPLPSLPQVNLPGAAGAIANAPLNQQLNQALPFGGFGLSARAVAQVSAETIARYADMDSSTLLPRRNPTLSASWTPPLAYALDQQEEQVFGGPLVNFIFGVGGSIYDIVSAMGFSHSNQVATALIASGKEMGGARTARIFGSPEWGFNSRGYIDARVAVSVRNEWFGSGLGRMILPNAQAVLTERHGLLADDWGLQDGSGQIDAGSCTSNDPRQPGHVPQCAMWQQVQRMYLVNNRTRQAFMNLHLRPFVTAMRGVLSATATPQMGPGAEELGRASVVTRAYASPTAGRVQVQQDTGPGQYETAPASGEYGATLRQRGRWFMGCKEAMQLGCTDTLSQENPFGDYLVRE